MAEERWSESDLRRRIGMRYVDLDPILEDLAKEGRINWLSAPTGKEMISLRADSRTKPGRAQG